MAWTKVTQFKKTKYNRVHIKNDASLYCHSSQITLLTLGNPAVTMTDSNPLVLFSLPSGSTYGLIGVLFCTGDRVPNPGGLPGGMQHVFFTK